MLWFCTELPSEKNVKTTWVVLPGRPICLFAAVLSPKLPASCREASMFQHVRCSAATNLVANWWPRHHSVYFIDICWRSIKLMQLSGDVTATRKYWYLFKATLRGYWVSNSYSFLFGESSNQRSLKLCIRNFAIKQPIETAANEAINEEPQKHESADIMTFQVNNVEQQIKTSFFILSWHIAYSKLGHLANN